MIFLKRQHVQIMKPILKVMQLKLFSRIQFILMNVDYFQATCTSLLEQYRTGAQYSMTLSDLYFSGKILPDGVVPSYFSRKKIESCLPLHILILGAWIHNWV